MAVLAPARPTYDPADLLLTDIEFGSEFGLFDAALFVSRPDLVDLSLAELSHAVTCPTVVGDAVSMSALANGVLHVDGTGAYEPVSIVLTGRVVAGVADVVFRRDGADSLEVSPLRCDHPCAVSDIEDAVSILSTGRIPGPALVWTMDIDLGPVGGNALGSVIRRTHNDDRTSDLEAQAMNEEDDYLWMA